MTTTPHAIAQRLLDQFLAEPGTRVLAELIHWLLEASPAPAGPASPRTQRLAALLDAILRHERSERLQAKLRAVWAHGSGARLVAEMGLPAHGTLVKESLERFVDRVVPRLEPPDDLYVLVSRLDLDEGDVEWFEGLTPADLAPWSVLVMLPRESLAGAARLLALRAAATGIARDLLRLHQSAEEGDSPFFRLPPAIEGLIRLPADSASRDAFRTTRGEIAGIVRGAYAALDVRGVSTDVLYRLELLDILLARLDRVAAVLTGVDEGHLLVADVLRGGARQHGVRSLARNTLKRLAHEVTEHTAETGEHYVVRDRDEWDATGRSAAGGGLVTAFTALVKYAVAAAPVAPFVQGVAAAFNYSASFVAMQFAQFTLASKQPAMTGASLATVLGNREDLDRQVELVAGITRSQVAATIGNVFATIPVSVAIVTLARLVAGVPVLPEATAVHSVHSVHPLFSLTIPYALLTGVFLWLASLAAGWAANWSAYRGLPEAIAAHRGLTVAIGARRAGQVARLVRQHLSGIVGYLALGFLLGFVPVALSRFVGVPLEVRHVTLQAASLALAAASLYGTPAFHWTDVAWGALGIVVIAACNIGVSFALALRTAMRARDLGHAERARLWRAIRVAFRRRPSRFLWRPAADASAAHAPAPPAGASSSSAPPGP